MASWAYDGQDTALAGAVAAPSSALGLIRRMLRRHRGRLAGSYLLLSLWQICEALVPVAIGMIIDHAIAPGDLTAFVIGAAGLCVLMGVLSFAYRYGARLGFGAVQREQHALRVELTAHVLHPRGAQTGLLPGETLAVATGDAAAVGLVVRQLGYAFSAVAVLIFCAVYLLTLDLWLGLLVLIGVPVSIGLTQLVSPVIARRFGTEQAAVARAAGMATDLVEGMRPLKGVGAEHLASARYHDVSRAAERAAVQTVRGWAGLAAVTTAVSGLLLAAVALVAGARALSGDLSLGEFIAVVGLTQFLAEPVAQIGFIGADAARSSASASRIVEVLQAPRRIVEGHRAPGSPYGLRLAHVATGPLRDVTLHADEGELVAVVVDDPACSDALVGVLTGERTPDSGEAVLGDARIDGLDVDARRRALLVAEHRVDLFDGTARTNVDPHGTADASRLAEVLDASAADDVVALHPDGLERHVRVSGSLSGGQRQRLALARALIADAPVLLLQDPTSAVDSVTEEAIARGVRTFRHRPRPAAPRTTVIVTTSPSLLAQADRVHLVRDGRTVAEGVHAELLDRDDYVEAVLR